MAATAHQALSPSPQLVGRSVEFATLWASVANGGGLVLVEGEAGVGKTCLITELKRDAARRFLLGRCYPVREAFPLGPVVEALRGVDGRWQSRSSPLTGALRPLLPELADRLPPAPEPLGDVLGERYRLFRGTIDLLAALGPTVLAIEDMHWSDESTCDLTTLLLQSLPANLSLVLSYRSHDLDAAAPFRTVLARLPPRTTRIDLQPLGVDEVRTLTGTLLHADNVSEQFAHLLWERTGGVPFAVEEVLRLLRGRNDLVERRGQWMRRTLDELAVPAAIRDTVLERLGRLGADARIVARAAAVWGGVIEDDAVPELSGLPVDSCAPALSEAIVAAMLSDDNGRIDFRHSLARQAVYDGTPGPDRRLLHARSAELLVRREPHALTRRAHHYRLAGRTAEWVQCAEQAADRLAAGGDVLSAAAFVEDAAATSTIPLDTRVRLALKLASWSRHGPRFERSVQILRDLLQQPNLTPPQRGELRASLGMLVVRYDVAGLADLEAALPDLAHRPDLYARALSTLAIPRLTATPVSTQLAWAERAVEVAAAVDDAEARVAVVVDRTALLGETADPGFRAALDVLPQPGAGAAHDRQLLRATINAVDALTGAGHYDEAAEWAGRADRLFDELAEERESYLGIGFEIYRLILRWSRGEWAGIEADVRSLLARGPTQGQLEHLLGRLLAARGDLPAAEERLRHAIDVLTAEADLRVAADAAGGLAAVLLARGSPEEAVAAALPALLVVRRKGAWTWATQFAPPLVAALLVAGRAEEAAELVADLAAGLADRDAPAGLAALAECRGQLAEHRGDFVAAAGSYDDAATRWKALPNPLRAAYAAESAGRVLAAAGQSGGVARLEDAHAGFIALGATWDANRVASVLRRAGAGVPHRRGRRGYGAQLSPREREVADLLTDGLTNRQIAEALFLSPRTAEAHVARVLRKLGVPSRDKLAQDGRAVNATGRQ